MLKGFVWWKWLGAAFVYYALIAGLLGDVPRLPILNETIRNLYFHVTMWFSMLALMIASLIYSIRTLGNPTGEYDLKAAEAVNSGLFLGILGLFTGMVWAKFTWGAFWVNDPKLNGTAVTILIYLAYIVLRGSLTNPMQRARISAMYNIFAFVLMIVFIGILPRMTDSLHPGNGGNPAFSSYDLDNRMRLIFYPAVIGWALLGAWIMDIRIRMKKLTTDE